MDSGRAEMEERRYIDDSSEPKNCRQQESKVGNTNRAPVRKKFPIDPFLKSKRDVGRDSFDISL